MRGGYRGVPTFIISDKHGVDGAADASDFLGAVRAGEGPGECSGYEFEPWRAMY